VMIHISIFIEECLFVGKFRATVIPPDIMFWHGRVYHSIFIIISNSSSKSYTHFPFVGKVKVKLSPCLTNEALRHEDVWGSGCIDPHFLDLGTSWRWVVSFMPLPLYPGKEPPVPIL
jgi:hypothetical protein